MPHSVPDGLQFDVFSANQTDPYMIFLDAKHTPRGLHITLLTLFQWSV